MSSTMINELLELRPDTVQCIRKSCGFENPMKLEEAIDILNDWIQKQNHFMEKTFPRKYLETCLLNNKGSIERTKLKLERLCTLRTIFSQFYNFSDVKNHCKDMSTVLHLVPLPKLTEDHYRIVILKLFPSEMYYKISFIEYYILFLIYCEYFKMHNYSSGCIFIFDYRDIRISDIISKFNPLDLKQLVTLLLDGYGMRIQSVHFITASKTIESFLNIVKPLFPAKIAKRMYVYKTIDTLYELIPKSLLPTEFGGTTRSLKDLRDDWIELLNSKETLDYLNWTKKMRVDESYRLTDKYDEYIGMSGTFRSISID